MPYQEPSGKWRATKMIAGKRKTRLFVTKTEAKKWEAAQTEEDWRPKEEIPTVCWLDFATEYLQMAEEKYSEKTFDEKKLVFRRTFRTISPQQMVEKTTVAQAADVIRSVARESSGYAANKVWKNLAAAWEWGKRLYGLPHVNPFKEVDKMPADATPRYVPPEEDFWKVYDSLSDKRDRAFLLFLLHTGARIQEALRLVWSDIDFDRQQIRLGTRKTATGGMEYAWIPMTTELKNVLLDHRKQSTSISVFVAKKTGKQMVHRQRYMRTLCEKAGVKPFGFHGIRHLTATILAHAGLDLPSVQAILRHHSPTTTARYIKSLGVQVNTVDAIFSDKKRGAKTTTLGSSK